MKIFIIFLSCFCFGSLIAQTITNDSTIQLVYKPVTKTYIKGFAIPNENEYFIAKVRNEFLNENFTICLTDTTYKIRSFQVTLSIENGDLVTWVMLGNKIEPNKEYYRPYSLKSTDYSLISFDNFIVEKEGKQFKASPFIIKFVE